MRSASAFAAGLACALSLLLAGGVDAGSGHVPRCFGAASRDPEHPCRNPALRDQVTPRPDVAVLQPDPTCEPPPSDGRPPPQCEFGVPAADASETVLLIGDSHASHWRPALAVVAAGLRWHVISLTQSSCPFTLARMEEHEPRRGECASWNRQVARFATDHPDISTVVVSEDHEPIVVAPGSSRDEQTIQGFIGAWQTLPDTVRHIVVIRDGTWFPPSTAACVTRAARRHGDAGAVCARPRSKVLKRDLAVAAADRERAADPGSRVVVADLSQFLCGPRWCYPVVGGVLVHKDDNHLTLLYARTLGPYLERAIVRLIG